MMSLVFEGATFFTALVFLVYGLLCLFSGGMLAEFERWGLGHFRKLTGSLEVLGGVGLIVGYFVTPVLVLASGGLALLMLLGLIARLRTRDPLFDSLPAVVLMVVNLVLCYSALGMVRNT